MVTESFVRGVLFVDSKNKGLPRTDERRISSVEVNLEYGTDNDVLL